MIFFGCFLKKNTNVAKVHFIAFFFYFLKCFSHLRLSEFVQNSAARYEEEEEEKNELDPQHNHRNSSQQPPEENGIGDSFL